MWIFMWILLWILWWIFHDHLPLPRKATADLRNSHRNSLRNSHWDSHLQEENPHRIHSAGYRVPKILGKEGENAAQKSKGILERKKRQKQGNPKNKDRKYRVWAVTLSREVLVRNTQKDFPKTKERKDRAFSTAILPLQTLVAGVRTTGQKQVKTPDLEDPNLLKLRSLDSSSPFF